jgi:hypothetical protein
MKAAHLIVFCLLCLTGFTLVYVGTIEIILLHRTRQFGAGSANVLGENYTFKK